jgi:glucosamine-6-phosphate deaminase
MNEFRYAPSTWVPFRNQEVLDRARKITREEIEKHPNPDFRIRVVKDTDLEHILVSDMFWRIKTAADEGRKLVLILPNPAPAYRKVAHLINLFRVNCSRLHCFAMDEYANENDEIAPETWRFGFIYAMHHNLLYQIDEELRPPKEQIIGPTTKNINDYGKMIEDAGGADACYSGPGWTGHLAFIEPDAPEFDAPLDEWKRMGPRIVTLSPFTLAQNSLHGSFGMSGDIAKVPPRAATIGPKQVIDCRYRMDMNGLGIHGTATSWQRLMTRLVTHGPVTPKLPTSIHQELKSDCYITENIARNIEPDWDKGY